MIDPTETPGQLRSAPTDGERPGGLDPQQKAAEVAEQAEEKVREAAGQLQGRLRDRLEEQSSRFAEQISESASDLRSVAESLRRDGKSGAADAAEQLAGYAQRAGGYLSARDAAQLLDDLEQFGRRQPWAISAGGLLLGFAAARFLKASSRERYAGRLTVSRPAGVYTPSPAGNGGPASVSTPHAADPRPPAAEVA